MSMSTLYQILIIILGFNVFKTECSNGDRSQYYRECLTKCYSVNCTEDMNFRKDPATELRLLLWTCEDDCRYSCMWKTVDYFTLQGFSVPQFHGKWPFARLVGLQEPASVFFSLLNFLAHFMMFRRFRQQVRSSDPLYSLWIYFSVVCMNGWIWSMIFHARDKPFTEVMDYSCAFVMVLTSLYCILSRIAFGSYKTFALFTGAYIAILYVHLSHLWSGKINYGYNMKFNIAIGLLTFVVTMTWWYRNRRILGHASLLGWFNILTVLSTLLEVADFPPILWTFDAHSLWHASTAPVAILLYRFIIQDCRYLRRTYDKSLLDAE